MKNNLKNRPKWIGDDGKKSNDTWIIDLVGFKIQIKEWFEDFEKELRKNYSYKRKINNSARQVIMEILGE